jgi:hypothetical protein
MRLENGSTGTILAIGEVGAFIICACLAVLRPLLKEIKQGINSAMGTLGSQISQEQRSVGVATVELNPAPRSVTENQKSLGSMETV